MLSSNRNMASHVIYAVSAISILLLTACGDPAPYEGIEKPPQAGTMPEVTSAAEAVKSAEIATVDLQTMETAEFEEIISAGPRCTFAYTSESQPVFAASMNSEGGAVGAVSIHGKLVRVMAREVKTFETLTRGATFTANGLQVEVIPDSDEDIERNEDPRRQPANVIFELEQGLKVGYRGWYLCRGEKPES